MKTRILRSGSGILIRRLLTIIFATTLVPVGGLLSAQNVAPSVPTVQETSRIPPEQLDSLVAPIALYPDDLLSQTLVASTYPLEVIQLQQWLARNPGLKDKALAEAVSKKPWDPSVQAMAALPEVVKRLADDIEWTTDLGNAFLAQQSDVMDAVQRMREKARNKGVLKTNEYQKVESEVIDETKKVIVVEQADPEIVYVPSYNPLYVFGTSLYPYPEIYYPYYPYWYPYYPWGVSAISYGLGWAMGSWWGGWGWHPAWGYNHININRYNYFNRYGYRSGYGYRGHDNVWQHNPQHRWGTPYRDRSMADRFGGTARGDSLVHRQAGARQQLGRQGWSLPSTRDRAGGFSDRGRVGGRAGIGGVTDRARPGGVDRSRPGGVDRSRPGGIDRSFPGGVDRSRPGGVDRSRPGGVDRSRPGGVDRSRPGGIDRARPGGVDRARPGGVDRARPGGVDRSRPGGVDRSRPGAMTGRPGGADRIGGRDVGRSAGGSRSAFGTGSRGYSGSGARASSSRGSSSVGGSRAGSPRGGGRGGRH